MGILFTMACADRTNSIFKLNGDKFTLDVRKIFFYCEGGETLEEFTQSNCGCLFPGSVSGQVQRVLNNLI